MSAGAWFMAGYGSYPVTDCAGWPEMAALTGRDDGGGVLGPLDDATDV